jgi:hypothetical protein
MARLTLVQIEVAVDEADTLELEFEWIAGVEPLEYVDVRLAPDDHDTGRYDCYCCCPCHNPDMYSDYLPDWYRGD